MAIENLHHHHSTPHDASAVSASGSSHDTGRLVAEIQQWMISQLAEELQINRDKMKVDQPILSCGIDSMQVVIFVAKLEDWLGIRFSNNPLEEHSTIEALSHYVADMAGKRL